MSKINYLKLAFSLLITFLAGAAGTFFTNPAIPTWYATLNKPSFSPPNWLFGPVWTILYILMAIAFYLIWTNNKAEDEKKSSYAWFFIQLLLNASWSIVFFGFQSPLAGLVIIIAMWLAILLTIIYFARISKVAAYLLVPYLLWVSFASALNYMIFILNK